MAPRPPGRQHRPGRGAPGVVDDEAEGWLRGENPGSPLGHPRFHAKLREPMHGYQVMERLEEESGGTYSASPGSVYPVLHRQAVESLREVLEQTIGRVEDGRRPARTGG